MENMLLKWTAIATYSRPSGAVDTPWMLVLESFDDFTHLKLKAKGSWSLSGGYLPQCPPDGLPGIKPAEERLVMPSCRLGALLGKVGGSSANYIKPDTPSTEGLAVGEPFAIGTFCIQKLPENLLGPLFVGFNTIDCMIEVQELSVEVYGARPTV